MIEVACAIIKNKNGELLMVQRSSSMNHPLQWEFAGGKLQDGETARQAVVREIWEELELKVRPLKELNPVIWEYSDKKIALLPVICEIRSGNLCLKEHLDYRWLAIEEVKNVNVLEADRLIVQQLEGPI